MSQSSINPASSVDLHAILVALHKDYAKLAPRIRELQHEVACEGSGVTLRLHFPSFRQAKTTVRELVDQIWLSLPHFALSRKEVDDLKGKQATLPFDDFLAAATQLNDAAAKLFIKAHRATNRNGEAGELLLYLLTEWILGAPQVIAKMTLKTNPQMPVHGADGVHVRYCPDTERLFLYWGESKLYQDVGAAISAAATSIAKSVGEDELGHELQLVQRNLDFAGLDDKGKAALLRYLDPHEEAYNNRKDVVTCLIGFDFDGFEAAAAAGDKAEEAFRDLARAKLAEVAPKVSAAFKSAGLAAQEVELFFFPLPAVQDFRDLFQKRIGWLS